MSILKRRGQLMLLVGVLASVVAVAAIGLVVGAFGNDSQGENSARQLGAHLTGFHEVPSLNSPGYGSFRATMTPDRITFTLTYADLLAPPSVAHIHVGQRRVNGGVSVFLCGGGKPACPAGRSGSVSGTIVAADVTGPTTQGFKAGDLTSLERAIRADMTYTNIHTSTFPNGEIRGQIWAEDAP